jgi:hypothetical protein
VIVFIVGGVTFEEAKEVALEFNGSENKVVIGGTSIHNFKTFIQDLANFQFMDKFATGQMQAFQIE